MNFIGTFGNTKELATDKPKMGLENHLRIFFSRPNLVFRDQKKQKPQGSRKVGIET